MWELSRRWFLSGRAHVYYGLLVVIGVSIVRILSGDDLWLVPLIVSVGVFVDLWSHNYHH